MKVFVFNSIFLLPDDFTGDMNDALNEIIKYRIANATNGKKPEFQGEHITDKKLWDSFLANIEKGNNLTAGSSMQELVNNEWIKIPLIKEDK